jgi:arabinogalactan endo-1,4-beta-galactosidase
MNGPLDRKACFVVVYCLVLLGFSSFATAQDKELLIATDNFIIGADMSGIGARLAGGFRGREPVPAVEEGVHWTDTVRKGGLNYVRLRIFNDPTISNGHERAYSSQGFCDLPHTIEIARQIKAAGLGLLLDFHYSDTWADPGKQWKPMAWNDLEGKELEQALYDFTKDVLTQLKAAGAAPEMVQVGNEVINGMLWPDGRIDEYGDWTVFCNLLKAGVRAVRDFDPDIKIMMHLALGGENHRSRNFLDKIIAQGVDFDIIGKSYYAQWHGTLSDLRSNLFDLAGRYDKPIMLVEYGGWGTDVRTLHDIVRALPDGKGIGACIFGGERLAGARFGWRRRGDDDPDVDPLEVYRKMARDYSANKTVKLGDVGIRKAPSVTSFKPISGVDVSMIPELEAKGVAFVDGGAKKDAFQILAGKDANMARVDVLFKPDAEGGYSKDGYGSLDHALAVAKRARAAGLKLMVVVHYSDTWASRDRQVPPAEWKPRLEEDLESTLFQYTRATIAKFEEQGTPPDIVQIGNEISDGFLLPKGVADIEGSFGGLVRVGSAAAREASPKTNVMVSMATAGDLDKSREFIRTITEQDMIYDAIAMSYDPARDGSVAVLGSTLTALAETFKIPLAVVTENTQDIEEIRAAINGLPGGLGLGTFVTRPAEGGLLKTAE